MLTRIHVNQHNIKANAKNGTNLPVFTVKTYKSNQKCNRVEINGPSVMVYSPDQPLDCGAKCWLECDSNDVLTDNYVHNPSMSPTQEGL